MVAVLLTCNHCTLASAAGQFAAGRVFVLVCAQQTISNAEIREYQPEEELGEWQFLKASGGRLFETTQHRENINGISRLRARKHHQEHSLKKECEKNDPNFRTYITF
jgi:hypothetical protein